MGPIEFIFPKLSMFARTTEPAVIATPHVMGELFNANEVQISGGDKTVPSQSQVTSRWQDGSVKWLHTRFLADLPANNGCEYSMQSGEPALPAKSVKFTRNADGGATLENGSLTIMLGAPGLPIISGLFADSGVFQGSELSGPYIKVAGERFEAAVGENGWETVENGPVFAAVRTYSKHISAAGNALLDFELTVSVYAGKPQFELEYRVINSEESPFIDIEAMRYDFCPDNKAERFCIARSHYGTRVWEGKDEPLRFFVDEAYVRKEDIEHTPEVFAGTLFADWRDGSRGMCLYINKAFQNYPKLLEVDRGGIRAYLIPEGSPIRLFQGSSKRHRILIGLHSQDNDSKALDIAGLQYEMPDKPFLRPEAYMRAGLYKDYILPKSDMFMEAQLRNLAYNTRSALGMMNFGDWWDGEWQNNEYDAVHWFMVQHVRTGERAMHDKMLVYGEHLFDMDINHFSHDPRRKGAHIQHSPEHATGDVEVCHQWTEGLIDYYHATGDKRALDAAIGVARNVIYILENKIYHRPYYGYPRELGWALRALVAVFGETYDTEWAAACDKIVARFFKWQEEFGAWLSPYTTHAHIRVPFMQSVAIRALALYERVKPDENVRKMVLHEIDDILNNGVSYTGLFYYKELPSIQVEALLGHIFEAVAIGYQYTGDPSYIERAHNAFVYFMRYKINDIRSPRNFAEAYPGIVAYMKALGDLGKLQ